MNVQLKDSVGELKDDVQPEVGRLTLLSESRIPVFEGGNPPALTVTTEPAAAEPTEGNSDGTTLNAAVLIG